MRKSISVTFFSMVATLLVLGTAVLLDGIAARIEEELGRPATLVVTGGLAPVVLPYCRRKAIHVPDLVLEGLYRYWQLNR